MSWFRFYGEVLNDPKVQLLPASVFKVWVNCLCLACNNEGKLPKFDDIIFAMRITSSEGKDAFEQLVSAGILSKDKEENYSIKNWEKRQFCESKKQNEEQYFVYLAGDEDLTEIKIGHSKNPWARIANLQTGTTKRIKVVATIKTNGSGDRWLADYFGSNKISGEWFAPDVKLITLIKALNNKEVRNNKNDVVKWLDSYVATTTQTQNRTDTESNSTPLPPPPVDNFQAPVPDQLPEGINYLDFVEVVCLLLGRKLKAAEQTALGEWCELYDKRSHVWPVLCREMTKFRKREGPTKAPSSLNYFSAAMDKGNPVKALISQAANRMQVP